ncbi:MAG TPA: hypothetical protein VLC92_06510 [Rhodocyclaceae bacterium]|nr:hypothetical protein [Rhodocyclaceae bacterium]
MGALTDMPGMLSMAECASHPEGGPPATPELPAVASPIIASDALFDLVMRFNLFPAEYAHPSWLIAPDAFLEPLGLGDLSIMHAAAQGSAQCPDFSLSPVPSYATPMWMRHMSIALLGLRDLESQYDFDYSDTGKRLALLDTPSLLSLARQAAALLARPFLQGLIRGDEVAAVDAVIGRALRIQTLAQPAGVEHIALALKKIRDLACGAMLDAGIWSTLPMQIALSVLPEDAAGTRARLRFRFPHEHRRLPRFALSELQRRELVQVCLVAAPALNDATVDAMLCHRARAAEGASDGGPLPAQAGEGV